MVSGPTPATRLLFARHQRRRGRHPLPPWTTTILLLHSNWKKQKREEEWALAKKQELDATSKNWRQRWNDIDKRTEQYYKENAEQEKELMQLRREAKLKGGFNVEPEAKLLFITRIRGNMSLTLQILRPYQLESEEVSMPFTPRQRRSCSFFV